MTDAWAPDRAALDAALRLDGPPCWFGAPGAMRRELTALVLAGTKTATAGLLAEFALDGDDLPRPGTRSAVIDDDAMVVAVMTTTRLDVVRMADVTWEFARDEGEGFVDVADWRRQHEAYWNAHSVPAIRTDLDPAFTLDDDTLVACEWFMIEVLADPVPWPSTPSLSAGSNGGPPA